MAASDDGGAPGHPVTMTDANFQDMIKKNKIVVIDCWAEWCSPCKHIAPIIEELAKDFKGRIVFAKLDVDSNKRVPVEFKIMAIPTLLIFKDGELADRIIGLTPKPRLVEKLNPYLA